VLFLSCIRLFACIGKLILPSPVAFAFVVVVVSFVRQSLPEKSLLAQVKCEGASARGERRRRAQPPSTCKRCKLARRSIFSLSRKL